MSAISTTLVPEEVDMIWRKIIFSMILIVSYYICLTHSSYSETGNSCGGNESGGTIRFEWNNMPIVEANSNQ